MYIHTGKNCITLWWGTKCAWEVSVYHCDKKELCEIEKRKKKNYWWRSQTVANHGATLEDARDVSRQEPMRAPGGEDARDVTMQQPITGDKTRWRETIGGKTHSTKLIYHQFVLTWKWHCGNTYRHWNAEVAGSSNDVQNSSMPQEKPWRDEQGRSGGGERGRRA